MIEDSLKRLASSEIITDKLDQIIEAFVSFYGEERRWEIENRLKSALILKFTNTYTLSDQISNVKRCIFKEVYGLPEDEFMFFNISFGSFDIGDKISDVQLWFIIIVILEIKL